MCGVTVAKLTLKCNKITQIVNEDLVVLSQNFRTIYVCNHLRVFGPIRNLGNVEKRQISQENAPATA